MGGTPYERLQQALQQVVRDFGPEVLTEPARVRSALSDLLSDDALSLRDDVDAVVLAADAGIPSALEITEPPPDAEELVGRLTARGATPERAGLAIRLWSSTLGGSVPDTDLPDVPALALEPLTTPEAAPTALPDSGGTPELEPDLEPAPQPELAPGWAVPTPGPTRSSRVPLVLAGVGIALVVAVVIGVVLATSSGGGGGSQTATARAAGQRARRATTTTTTTLKTTATTAKPATPTTAPPGAAPGGGNPKPRSTGPETTTDPTEPPTTQPTQPPPPPTTAPPPTDPPVANDDSWTWAPDTDGSVWYEAQLPVVNNDSGAYNRIDKLSEATHGAVRYENGTFIYSPHHNGDAYDSFTYRLSNTDTGEYSDATVYLHLLCNTAYVCY